MEENGLQVSITSQNYPVAFDEEQGIFQTVFNLHGKILDNWVETDQETKKYATLKIAAVSDSPETAQVLLF